MEIRRRRRVDAAVLAGAARHRRVPAGRRPGGAADAAFGPAGGPSAAAEGTRVAWLIGAAVDGYLDLEGDDGQVTQVRLSWPPPTRSRPGTR